MKNRIIIGLASIGFLLMSCQADKPNQANTDTAKVYFDISSFLEKLKQDLQQRRPNVQKKAVLNNERTNESIVGDSSFWEKELKTFADADINKPALRLSYQIDQKASGTDTTWNYSAKEEGLSVKQIFVSKKDQQVDSLFLEVSDENSLYKSSKRMSMKLSDGELRRYYISGEQKLIIGDSLNFSITGTLET